MSAQQSARSWGGLLVASAMAACRNEPQCASSQYWSSVLRACVGVGEYMDAHGGSFPDGYVAPDAASGDGAMDSGASCDGGEVACGARCTSTQSDPLNCGACGVACTSSANATATCVEGRCDLRCDTGAHRCGASCVRDSDPASCGTRCSPCPEPLGASATCAMGACGYACLAGYDDTGAACEMRAPRPLFPWGTSTVTQLRPTLQWELPMGVEGAQVELCRDRACTMVIERVNAVGSSAQPATALPSSTVVFWRLRGRIGASNGARTSATWQFRTPAVSATTADTAHGLDLDLNGDGFSDVAIGAPGADGGQGRVDVYYGSATGLGATPGAVLRGTSAGEGFGTAIASVGDVNGDGFADMAVGAPYADRPSSLDEGSVALFLGSATGVTSRLVITIRGTAGQRLGGVLTGTADVDGDGYADMALGIPNATVGADEGVGAFTWHHGSATLATFAAGTLVNGPSDGRGFASSLSGAGDVDGDRLADIAVGAPQTASSAGAVYLLAGSSTGPRGPTTVHRGTSGAAATGSCVAIDGDANLDGYADLLEGASDAARSALSAAGTVTLHLGSASGVASAITARIDGDLDGTRLGQSCAFVGDLDGDGRSDIAVGSESAARRGLSAAGVVFVALTTAADTFSIHRTIEGTAAFELLGRALSHGLDVDGNHFTDVAIGAPGSEPRAQSRAGVMLVFSGSPTGIAMNTPRVIEGATNDSLGWSLADRTREPSRSGACAVRTR